MGTPVERIGPSSVRSITPKMERFVVSIKDARGIFSLFVESFTPNQSQQKLRTTRDLWCAQRFSQNSAHAVARKISTFDIVSRVERVSSNGMIREVA